MEITCNSESHTDKLGVALAQVLEAGTTVALNGELGAGKTHFVRAVCRGLGADESRVNSPTFVLLQSYTDGRLPVHHFDAYRLADGDEFLTIGAEEFLGDSDAVCFVEWADRMIEVLPSDHVSIRIEQIGERHRRFVISATGPLSQNMLTRLQTGRRSFEKPPDG